MDFGKVDVALDNASPGTSRSTSVAGIKRRNVGGDAYYSKEWCDGASVEEGELDGVDEMFASEEVSTQKSNLRCEYAFQHEGTTTTMMAGNASYTLDGYLGRLRRQNRQSMDFQGGYAILKTSSKIKSGESSGELAMMMPLPNFLRVFSNRAKLLKGLKEKTELLKKEWNATNGRPEMAGHRVPLCKSWPLMRDDFVLAGKGKWKPPKAHSMAYILQLNTFGFTADQSHVARPALMTERDVKVIIRLLTTVGAENVVDKSSLTAEGLGFDPFSYSVTLPHFLNLLASDQFARFIEEATLIADRTADEIDEASYAVASKRAYRDSGNPSSASTSVVENDGGRSIRSREPLGSPTRSNRDPRLRRQDTVDVTPLDGLGDCGTEKTKVGEVPRSDGEAYLAREEEEVAEEEDSPEEATEEAELDSQSIDE